MNFKESYREAMKNEIIGSEKRAEIIRDIASAPERRHVFSRRPLLIAAVVAALAVALVVSAAAVVHFGITARTDENGERWADITTRTFVEGDFSDAVLKRIAENEGNSAVDHEHFDSWQELQDYIGVDLLDNAYLDGFPAVEDGVLGGYDAGFPESCVSIRRCHMVGGVTVQVLASLSYGEQEAETVSVPVNDESYYPFTLSDGTEVWIPYAREDSYAAGFPMVVDGICYTVWFYDWPDDDTEGQPSGITDEVIQNVMGGFVFN